MVVGFGGQGSGFRVSGSGFVLVRSGGLGSFLSVYQMGAIVFGVFWPSGVGVAVV